MPWLPGDALTDASAAALTDGSAQDLIEAGIQVIVGPGGILHDGVTDPLGGLLDLLRRFQDAVDLGEWLVNTAVLASISNGITLLLDNQKRLTWVSSTEQPTYEGPNAATWQGYSINELLDRIDGIASGGLTTEEHDHLLGLEVDPAAIAEATWNWALPSVQVQAFYALSTSYLAALNEGAKTSPLSSDPRFGLVTDQYPADPYSGPATVIQPTPDWDAILEDDTRLDWLQRTDTSGLTWYQLEDDGTPSAPLTDTFSNIMGAIVCLFSEEEFAATRPNAPPPVVTVDIPPIAPVWPGLANVTLGSEVALATQLTIDADMHGVVVAVTTPPQHLGRYLIGGHTLDYGVGRITFGTDRGDLEPWQYLGFREAIYTPRTMEQAASVHLQVLGGAEGTVRTFLRS